MEEKNNRVDRRSLQTKKLLQNALAELLKEKPLSQVSVTELCRRAGINRNTFYAHYKYPEDIAMEIAAEFYQEVALLIREITVENAFDTFCIVLKRIKERPSLSVVLGITGEYTDMGEILFTSIRKIYLNSWQYTAPTSQIERAYKYISAGYLAVVSGWVKQGMLEPIESVAKDLTAMNMAAFHAIVPLTTAEQ